MIGEREASSLIDMYNTSTGRIHHISYPQPELLSLTFGIVDIDSALYFRFNSYLYTLTFPASGQSHVTMQLIPMMTGSLVIRLGRYLVLTGENNDRSVFYIYDVLTRSSLNMITPRVQVQSFHLEKFCGAVNQWSHQDRTSNDRGWVR